MWLRQVLRFPVEHRQAIHVRRPVRNVSHDSSLLPSRHRQRRVAPVRQAVDAGDGRAGPLSFARP